MDEPENTQTHGNDTETSGSDGAFLTQPRSGFDLEETRRDLIALRFKHGANTPIGHRASNIIELIQTPELPAALLERQMASLQRLLQAAGG